MRLRTLQVALCVAVTLTLGAGCDQPGRAPGGAPLDPAATAKALVGAQEFDPDSRPAPPDSPQMQLLADLVRADRVEVLSLRPWDVAAFISEPPADQTVPAEFGEADWLREDRAREQVCETGPCVRDARARDHPVLGRVVVEQPAQLEIVRGVLADWVGRVPNYAAACIPEFRHAIVFDGGGRHYQVLLCYSCGQYEIAVDGATSGGGQSAGTRGPEQVDTLLATAGIPVSTPKR